ncbi:hypothetical protein SAMN02745900_03142 [Pseudomonas sp. URIL14HWK12:I8]|uniref:hypothetical protein n=1 Tax=unclassified Pseudomonas TaxID=196821 RepID=UPI00041F0A98|nr:MULTISPECIES: hypothetical protein [unclassified Pseudomonas]SNB77230.1 hypothetical protein SAMN02745900_03142 [Pseudomonas sp. URIL14HWK12:I8]
MRSGYRFVLENIAYRGVPPFLSSSGGTDSSAAFVDEIDRLLGLELGARAFQARYRGVALDSHPWGSACWQRWDRAAAPVYRPARSATGHFGFCRDLH